MPGEIIELRRLRSKAVGGRPMPRLTRLLADLGSACYDEGIGHTSPTCSPFGSTKPMKLEKLGPYRIGRLIGRGGMGEVYEGVHEETGEQAAVKILSPAMARSEGFRERFEAEIDSLRKLRHPHIVELYGYGEHEGTLFYSMELVDGRSLEDELCSERRFDWREVTTIAIQLCRALKHAHDHGIIHRDLKPANILLTPDDQVKLLDFGIARLFGGNHVTSAGGVLGTADYMSPEQADGRSVTDRCDQYSLGCVMYALATGGPPFTSSSLPKLLQMQRFAKPEPVRKYAPDMPEELERIVFQLLEKDPENRYPNVMVLARQLAAMKQALSRPVEEDDFHVSQQTERIELPPASHEGLAVTRVSEPADESPSVTAARLDVTQDATAAPSRGSGSETLALQEPTPPPATNHFTSMQEELARQQEQQAESWVSFAAPLAVLLVVVGLAAAGVWYLMRPESADALYARINQAAADEGPENWSRIAPDIKKFLEHHAEDPRSEEVTAYQEQLELERAERRLRLLVRQAGQGTELSPLERTYIEAMRYADADPERAIVRLDALVTLHGDHDDLNEPQRQCLALAQRQLARLQRDVQGYVDEHLTMLNSRLTEAESVQADDPERARRIWQALIELYEDKPWATAAVAEAQRHLAALPQEEPSTEEAEASNVAEE